MATLTVFFVHSKTCFVNLPLKWTNVLWDEPFAQTPGNVVFQLTWRPEGRIKTNQSAKTTYVGWAGGCVAPSNIGISSQSLISSDSHGIIEIDASFGQSQGLFHNQSVSVTPIKDALNAQSVSVEPVSIDDWEILELHAGYLEEQILNQLRIIHLNQIVTIWIHHQTCVHLKIVATVPESKTCLKLSQDVEIIVAPKLRNESTKTTLNPHKQIDLPPVELRFLPEYHARPFDRSQQLSQWTVFLSPQDMTKELHKESRVYLQHLEFEKMIGGDQSSGPEKATHQTATNAEQASVSSAARLSKKLPHAYATIKVSPNVPPGHVVMGNALQLQLCLEPFGRVLVQFVDRIDKRPSKIDIVTLSNMLSPMAAAEQLHNYLAKYLNGNDDECIIFDGMILPVKTATLALNAKIVFSKELDDSNVSSTTMSNTLPLAFVVRLMDIPSIEVGARVNANEAVLAYGREIYDVADKLYMTGFNELVNEAFQYISKCMLLKTSFSQLNISSPAGILISGPSGSGKTRLVETTALKLAQHQHLHHARVNCARLKQLSSTKVVEAIELAFIKAVWHAPSIVIFDDLDVLLTRDSESSGSKNQVFAHAFLDLMDRIVTPAKVFVVATLLDKTQLNGVLSERQIFGHTVEIKAPNKQNRIKILKYLSGLDLQSTPPNYDLIASLMDGYLVADIVQIVERARQSHAMRCIKTTPPSTLSTLDFYAAFEGFKSSAVQGVKLHTSDVSWSMIGGMSNVKQMLLETLKWPTMYPQIFSSFPLRLRSGLLLFGYPGCGKTMLASAVSKECGLNFISVKGPELLNKYIGASEKAVRDLFQRAQSARPCCLFFDEFDSIAPRRGHDNTGVTDRVVNQMLTQMDGAEGLEGVFVLAATSRPDLIDPALLRPGRLDKTILCDLPSRLDREDIIQTISKTLAVSSSVSISKLADQTNGFSGADIQGMMYSAHLMAIRESMGDELVGQKLENADSSVDDMDVPFALSAGKGKSDDHSSRLRLKKQLAALKASMKSESKATDQSNTHEDTITDRKQIFIQDTHIKAVLSKTRPSVSEADHSRLSRIYQHFLKGESASVGSRATLA
ncbi:Peroxisome biosynthesis protein pex1 [Batrachochytrium dendrobatidis]|nr:Peroxisome biosynthesis protein pex1 [Batrachochytrium dendrobatidis]